MPISPLRLIGPLLLLALAAGPIHAAEVAGVAFSERHRVRGLDLTLRGAALLRYRVVFKAYAAALYLPEGVGAASALADIPRRLEIAYFWPISAGDFAWATREGISRNVAPGAFDALREPIERFSGLYEDVAPGDRYALTYLPDVGTELALNGRVLGRVEGEDFARAIFAIWLGETPLDVSLKEALLGEARS